MGQESPGDFTVGQAVYFEGGGQRGPVMAVGYTDEHGRIACYWSDGGHVFALAFPRELLKPVPSSRPPGPGPSDMDRMMAAAKGQPLPPAWDFDPTPPTPPTGRH